MSENRRFRHRARQSYARLEGFFRDSVDGLSAAEVRRLFERDAPEAYSVLTREHREELPADDFQRFLQQARLFFLGLAAKLSPPRRLLFGAALVANVVALVLAVLSYGPRVVIGNTLHFELSTLLFLGAVGGLVFVLALELVDRVRVRDELEVARRLQRELLPSRELSVPGYRAVHAYRTANEVGGDYIQWSLLDDGRIALVIGDASGHGMAAGLLMAIADATLRTAIELDPRPRAVADLVNRTLVRTGGRRAFFSLFYGLMDPATGQLDWVCAGHPFPLLRRRGGGVEELGAGGLPLGLRPDLTPPVGSCWLRAGDLVVFYTDGLAEARSPEGEDFGFERLRRRVAGGGAAEGQRDALLAALAEHLADGPLADDVTLLVLERLPPLPEDRPGESP